MKQRSVKEIDALLPQTQCGDCGFAGCLPYAEALAQGSTTIDLCPPGSTKTLKALATLLNEDPKPFQKSMEAKTRKPAVAFIVEEDCIGCTICIQACPVDAIIGSAKHMHTIIQTECTGCGLCIEPCPVDCIEMLPKEESDYSKDLARSRFQAKKVRELKKLHNKEELYRQKSYLASKDKEAAKLAIQAKQDYIRRVVERAKAKQAKDE